MDLNLTQAVNLNKTEPSSGANLQPSNDMSDIETTPEQLSENEVAVTTKSDEITLFADILKLQFNDDVIAVKKDDEPVMASVKSEDTEEDVDPELNFINMYFPPEPLAEVADTVKSHVDNATFLESETDSIMAETTPLPDARKNTTQAQTFFQSQTENALNEFTSQAQQQAKPLVLAAENVIPEFSSRLTSELQSESVLPEMTAITSPEVTLSAKTIQTYHLETPMTSQAWPEQLAQRIFFVSEQPVKSAVLHLNPSQLGPIEINVSLKHDQASVQITSQHPITRDLIESSLPKLRELFHDQGLQLTHSTASQDSNLHHHYNRPHPNETALYPEDTPKESITLGLPEMTTPLKALGAVDYYI